MAGSLTKRKSLSSREQYLCALRQRWGHLPSKVRQGLERTVGGRVIRAVSLPGGFSPGVAALIDLMDGRRIFLKAAGPNPNTDTPDIHRSEIRIAEALPDGLPVPKLLGKYDDGEWVALAFEYVEGRSPSLPWKAHELHRVISALKNMSRALTPSPIAAPPIQEKNERFLQGWRRLLREREETGHALGNLDEWVERHLPELARLESEWPRAACGRTLLHSDIRSDNIILGTSKVYFVDWPWACIGAPWIDLMAMLPNVSMQGGPMPWELFDTNSLAEGVSTEEITTYLAALTGFYVQASRQPNPPGLTGLREYQHALSRYALQWLKRRTSWR